MIALFSVWIGLLVFLLSVGMVVYRPLFTDVTVVLVLWLGAPGALCLSGLVLWAYRKEEAGQVGVAAQRRQAKVAIVLAVAAAAIVYLLIIYAEKIGPN